MGLKEILEDIDANTDAEIEGITQKAEEEAKRISEEAGARSADKTRRMEAKSKSDAEQIMIRETSKANIAAKMAYDQEANNRIEAAIDKMRDRLQEYMKSAKYGKLLNALAAKAAAELGSDCAILVRKEDMQLLDQEAGFKLDDVKEHISGGLVAASDDGKMEIDYTLDALLAALHDRLAQKLLERVREGGD